MANNFPTPMPQASVPFVDVATGRLTLTGYRFWLNLWSRTGGDAGSNSAGSLHADNNLSDLASAAAGRTNLGLGSAATQPSSAFATAAQGALAASALQPNTAVSATAVDVDGQQVVGPRRTGWSQPSGTLSRGALDTGAVSLAQVAQALGALIADLSAHGLIGP